jgi:hypothetical protein
MPKKQNFHHANPGVDETPPRTIDPTITVKKIQCTTAIQISSVSIDLVGL